MSDNLTTTSDADATTTTLDAASTSHTADAVAFCPHARCQHLLVCGSYELRKEESPPRRVGQLLLPTVVKVVARVLPLPASIPGLEQPI